MSHDLTGHCFSCAKIFNRYPGFNEELRTWFQAIQIENPEAHISCAGRGRVEQEVFFHRGASRAPYGASAHNWNAAIDIWESRDGGYLLDPDWFQRVIVPNLYPKLNWYGKVGSRFKELPHVEISDWKAMCKDGLLDLVEV